MHAGAALGKAGADNEVLGLKNEVGRGNQVQSITLGSSFFR